MSYLTEWFEGRSVEEHYQRCNWSRVLTEIACAVVAGIILGSLPGCASTEEEKVCFMQFLGRTESGLSVVAQSCMTPEQFAESQK